MILMALSNKTGAIVLTTGNKSEMATGYATLYGDMAGGFAVLKDLYKTLVFRLSNWRNTVSPVIPQNIIDRRLGRAQARPEGPGQPAALRMLDAIIEAYMERDESPRESSPQASRRRGAAHGGHAQAQRVQASPGAGGHPRDPARLRQGLALSDNIPLPGEF